MSTHKKLNPELYSYELEEIESSNDFEDTSKRLKIIIHGANIIQRALEPVIKIGNITAKYPEVQPDEKTIVAYLENIPTEVRKYHYNMVQKK